MIPLPGGLVCANWYINAAEGIQIQTELIPSAYFLDSCFWQNWSLQMPYVLYNPDSNWGGVFDMCCCANGLHKHSAFKAPPPSCNSRSPGIISNGTHDSIFGLSDGDWCLDGQYYDIFEVVWRVES
ncbi:unnamed protein product [Dibothriocephalus latus]|uniref:Uncharacterized protein n=1 Tax=Dibothriocephalus latus TaxID=60516 RepID=A0A3P7M918_DIBLA|nr:unnamed protein product [Dibothriocephalus latus]